MDLQTTKADGNSRRNQRADAAKSRHTTAVERTTLWRYYRPSHRAVEHDARWHIHTRASGWLEQLFVRSEGQRVAKGDPLLAFTVKSSWLRSRTFCKR